MSEFLRVCLCATRHPRMRPLRQDQRRITHTSVCLCAALSLYNTHKYTGAGTELLYIEYIYILSLCYTHKYNTHKYTGAGTELLYIEYIYILSLCYTHKYNTHEYTGAGTELL